MNIFSSIFNKRSPEPAIKYSQPRDSQAVEISESVFINYSDIVFLPNLSKEKILKYILYECFSLKDTDKQFKESLLDTLLERERLGSTGIGDGCAMPHIKTNLLDTLLLLFGISKIGCDFDSMDGKPAHYFFVLLIPEDSANIHLKVLSKIAKYLKNNEFRNKLNISNNSHEVFNLFKNYFD